MYHPSYCFIYHHLSPTDLEVESLVHVIQTVILAKLAKVYNQISRDSSGSKVTHKNNTVPLYDLTRQEHRTNHVFPKESK